MPDKIPNYVKKLVLLDLPKGKVSQVQVLHDDWCDIFKGGSCNCDPECVPESIQKTEGK